MGAALSKEKKKQYFCVVKRKIYNCLKRRKRSEIPLICINGAHKDKKFVKVEEKKDNLICQIFEN